MQNERKISFNWAATIALAIATLAIVLFATVYKLPQIQKYEDSLAEKAETVLNTSFLENAIVNSEDDAPYLETGMDGYYYTANANGKISFYKFVDGSFVKEKTTKTISITLPGTDDGEKTEISFVSNGSRSIGFGVYSNKKSTNYPFAFLKVIENTITDNYDFIAFVDNDIEDYYNNTKTYNQAYAFSAKDSDVKEIFSLDGKNAFIPIDLIVEKNDGFYYFVENEDGSTYTLNYKSTISGNETPYSNDIALPYAFCKDGAILLLENDDAGLCLNQTTVMESTTIKVFTGAASNYVVKNNYILNKDTKTLYDISTNTEQTINADISISGLEDFAVATGATKIAIVTSENDSPMLYFYEFATSTLKSVNGNGVFLVGNPNLCFNDNYVLFLSPAESVSKVANVVIPWDNIK